MRLLICLCFLFVFTFFAFAQNKNPKKIRLPQNLVEASGLYYAGSDSLWWHNDSGDEPRLVLTDQKGNIKKEIKLPIKNRDWEDITSDNFDNIYIGDFGNNANARKDLCIYIFNPNKEILDSILFTYPDQQAFPPPSAQCNFDMEGFFWYHDSLHLFSKNRLITGNYYTKHYIIPAQAGVFIAELRDSFYLKNRVVTAAAISPDGQNIALLSYFFRKILGFIPKTRTTIWSFSDFSDSDFFKGNLRKQKVKKCLVPTQFEALDFIDNQLVYVASERTPLYKQKAKLVKLKPSIKVILP